MRTRKCALKPRNRATSAAGSDRGSASRIKASGNFRSGTLKLTPPSSRTANKVARLVPLIVRFGQVHRESTAAVGTEPAVGNAPVVVNEPAVGNEPAVENELARVGVGCVCNQLFIDPYMWPEGPWQRLAAALADSSLFHVPIT